MNQEPNIRDTVVSPLAMLLVAGLVLTACNTQSANDERPTAQSSRQTIVVEKCFEGEDTLSKSCQMRLVAACKNLGKIAGGIGPFVTNKQEAAGRGDASITCVDAEV